MEIYRLYSQNNDEDAVCDLKEYATFWDAEIVLRKMIAEQGKKMNVAAYISAIRKGKNRNYRKIIADALKNIFLESEPLSVEKIKQMKASIEDFTFDCCLGDKEPMDDFDAYTEGGRIVIIEFHFDQKLHVEFDINTDFDYNNDGIIGEYFFIQDRNGKFKVNIEEDVKPVTLEKEYNSANIIYVYKSLCNDALEVKKAIDEDHINPHNVLRGITPKQIQKGSQHFYGKQSTLSTETIVKHIHALKQLGIPIKQYKVSKEEKEFWKTRNIRCNEGYEIDIDFLDKVPAPVDASELGVSIKPLLILFVLKTAKKPMRQADIIKESREKYNVKIGRGAVGRHINFLINVAYPIKKSKDGYVYENGVTEK